METTLENALTVSFVGFTVSLATLLFFAAIIATINKVDKKIEATKKKKIKEEPQSSSTTVNNEDENLIPIITAAVTATVGKKIVIRKINFMQDANANSSWRSISRSQNHEIRNIQVSRRNYDK